MRVETRSITLAALPEVVYAYISEPANLPEWAPVFAESVRPEDDHWVATTARGETRFALGTNADFGVVDVLGLVAAEAYVLRVPTRVVPLGPDAGLYLVTLFARHGEDDASFEGRLAQLGDALARLQQKFAVTSAP
ncbi:MAG: SRPBCC family protein [Vulcanimicrobiaceae bacterium]